MENKRTTESYADQLTKEIGNYVALWCIRYTYRGRVIEVGKDYIKLDDAHAVEVTGNATDKQPKNEDCIPSVLTINLDAMEICCKPTWADGKCAAPHKSGPCRSLKTY